MLNIDSRDQELILPFNVKVVLLNGPPGSGKDTIANKMSMYVGNNYQFFHYKFSTLLKTQVLCDYGFYPIDYWLDYFEDRKHKEEPRVEFDGKSFREMVIDKSENKIKPILGKDFYGRYLARKITIDFTISAPFSPLVAISDSGFLEESLPMIKTFGAENMLLARIRAEERGVSYKGDSRSYLKLDIPTIDIDNNRIIEIDSDFYWYERCQLIFEALEKMDVRNHLTGPVKSKIESAAEKHY